MVTVQNLTKWFGSFCAVDEVSFEVKKGEVLGFLGPNGAGKSTSMRMITGYLPMDGGSVTIGEYNVAKQTQQAQSLVGYLPENAPSYGEMTVQAFLHFVAKLRGFSGSERKKRVEDAIATCFLEPVRFKPIDTLSKGYTHRTCLAQSILHDPEVLVLDEPTDGLDPNQKHEVRNLIKRMGERKAIIISTHILEEVDACCDRAIVINNGKIVANDTPDGLRKISKLAGTALVRLPETTFAAAEPVLKGVVGVDQVVCVDEQDGGCELRVFPHDSVKGLGQNLGAACQKEQWPIAELAIDRGRLDDVFREITDFDGGKK